MAQRRAKWSTDPNTQRESDEEPPDVTFAVREYQPRKPNEEVRRKLLAFVNVQSLRSGRATVLRLMMTKQHTAANQ